MRSAHALLIEHRAGWELYRPGGSRQPIPVDQDWSQLASHLGTLAHDIDSVTILLDSCSCLFGAFDLTETGGSRARDAMLFRFESDLPYSAEDLVADIRLTTSKPVVATMVAMRRDQLEAIESAVEAAGLSVAAILPASTVIARHCSERNDWPESVTCVLQSPAGFEVMRLRSRIVIEWSVRSTLADVRRELNDDDESETIRWLAIEGADPATELGSTENATPVGWNDLAATLFEGNRRSEWYDLIRAHRLEQQAATGWNRWQGIVVATAACCLIAAIALFWRGSQIHNASSEIQLRQEALWGEAFPGSRVPAAVLARLRSEHAKVRASHLTSSSELPEQIPAIPVLSEIVDRWPAEEDYSLLEARVENGQVYLDIQVDNLDDAGTLIEQLSQDSFSFSPPTAEIGVDGVRALVTGFWSEPIQLAPDARTDSPD